MCTNFLFIHFLVYILYNILLVNNSDVDYESKRNLFTIDMQIPVKRIFIDFNNNIYFTN